MVQVETMEQIFERNVKSAKESDTTFQELLMTPPPEEWLKPHEFATRKMKGVGNVPALYLPIERVEYMLRIVYGGFKREILRENLFANSITVVVRVTVKNPITGIYETNDGIGAKDLLVAKGSSPMDFSKLKNAAVMMAAPSAATYAFKNAVAGMGILFGGNTNREEQIEYYGESENEDAATQENTAAPAPKAIPSIQQSNLPAPEPEEGDLLL